MSLRRGILTLIGIGRWAAGAAPMAAVILAVAAAVGLGSPAGAAVSLPSEGISGPPDDALWGLDPFEEEKARYDARVAAYEAQHAGFLARVKQAESAFHRIPSKHWPLETYAKDDLETQ